MKICFVSTFFTGATLPFAHHLCEQGNEVDYYLFSQQGQKGMETLRFDKPISGSTITQLSKTNSIYNYLNSQVNIFLTPYYLIKNRKYLIGFYSYFKDIRIICRLAKRIEKGDYDVIYVIVNEEWESILCKKLNNKKIKNVLIAYHEVITSHFGEPKLKKVVKNTVNLGYPLITYSKHTNNVLSELTGKTDIHTLYFGPFETFKLYDSDEPIIKEDYILFIGRITKYKGLAFLYDTIDRYRNQLQSKVVVAGGGYDPILEKIKEDNKFILLNRFLSDSEFANLIKFAKCVVCPYSSGSQSGITHVSMVFNTPVIATKVGAFPEFIDEGKNGYLVNYGNSQQLFNKIETCKCNKLIIPTNLMWNKIVNHFKTITVVK